MEDNRSSAGAPARRKGLALAFAAALLLTGPWLAIADASFAERNVHPFCNVLPADVQDACFYQHDGGRPGDASDRCQAPDPFLTVNKNTRGILAPVDDTEDNYALDVNASLVGRAIQVSLNPSFSVRVLISTDADTVAIPSYRLSVWEPGCTAPAQGASYPSGSGANFVFVPQAAGVYTVQVALDSHLGEVKSPSASAPPGLGRTTATCNPICLAGNGLLGYDLGTYA